MKIVHEMKFSAWFLSFMCVVLLNASGSQGITVEEIRSFVRTGIPADNVPSVDPFIIPAFRYNESVAGFEVYFESTQVVIAGGGDFVASKFIQGPNPSYFEFNFTIPKLTITSETYSLGGKLAFIFDLNGVGTFRAALTDVTISGWTFVTIDTKINMVELIIGMEIGTVAVHFDNLTPSASTLMTAIAQPLIKANSNAIASSLRPYAISLFNQHVGNIQLAAPTVV